MSTEADDQPGGVTRRQIIAGASAAVAGAAVLGAVTSGQAGAAPAAVPQVLDPAITGLTYISIDALGFRTATATPGWYSDDFSGTGANAGGNPLTAPLSLPVGAVVKQINVAYQGGSPAIFIYERPLIDPRNPQALINQSLPFDGTAGPKNDSIDTNVVIKHGYTYALRINVAPGTSIFGMTIGYTPSAFSPFTGNPKRALDTRLAGGMFAPSEERILDLTTFGALGSAVVFNLTADQPEGIGFLSAYSGDGTFQNTSSLNYSPATPNIANGVITPLGSGNKIKIRCGEAATHVIVDVIGYLL